MACLNCPETPSTLRARKLDHAAHRKPFRAQRGAHLSGTLAVVPLAQAMGADASSSRASRGSGMNGVHLSTRRRERPAGTGPLYPGGRRAGRRTPLLTRHHRFMDSGPAPRQLTASIDRLVQRLAQMSLFSTSPLNAFPQSEDRSAGRGSTERRVLEPLASSFRPHVFRVISLSNRQLTRIRISRSR